MPPQRQLLLVLFALVVSGCLPIAAQAEQLPSSERSFQLVEPSADDSWDLAVDPSELGYPDSGTSSRRAAPFEIDPATAQASLTQLLGTNSSDLWGITNSIALSMDKMWEPTAGVYANGSVVKVRVLSEMLNLHSLAAVRGVTGAANRPERIAPLVKALTSDSHWISNTSRKNLCTAGAKECWHQYGWIDSGTGATMHRSRDAVAARALAAAWQARTQANLPQDLIDKIKKVLKTTAHSSFWKSSSILYNQINWNADILYSNAVVNGGGSNFTANYKRMLSWLVKYGRKNVFYKGGSPTFTKAMGFRYNPTRPKTLDTNMRDTIEYSNIVFGAMAYYDSAVSMGMKPISRAERNILQNWARHLFFGAWNLGGYLNWDTGHALDRIHLTQYWLLSLRGFAAGLQGSQKLRLLSFQQGAALSQVRRVVEQYQRRARFVNSIVLSPTSYGFKGTTLFDETKADGLIGTARFASILAEMADRDLLQGEEFRIPQAGSWDKELGRVAVATPSYSSAIVPPWNQLRTGGVEPSRIMDNWARPLTSIGGGGDGTLGLRISGGGSTLLDTQPGTLGRGVGKVSVGKVRVGDGYYDDTARRGPSLVTRAVPTVGKLKVYVDQSFRAKTIRTAYTVINSNGSSLKGELRIPTYGIAAKSSLNFGSPPTIEALKTGLVITSPSGARWAVKLHGLPKGSSVSLRKPSSQIGNPQPGPQITVKFKVPRGRLLVKRFINPLPLPDSGGSASG